MWYLCRCHTATEAVAMGLVNVCVPDEQLDEEVQNGVTNSWNAAAGYRNAHSMQTLNICAALRWRVFRPLPQTRTPRRWALRSKSDGSRMCEAIKFYPSSRDASPRHGRRPFRHESSAI